MKNALIPLGVASISLLTVVGTSCTGVSTASHPSQVVGFTTTSLPAGSIGTAYFLLGGIRRHATVSLVNQLGIAASRP